MSNTIPSLSYSQKDPNDVLTELQSQLAAFTNNTWTDFTDADIGWALVKTMEALLDKAAYWTDQNTAEGFLSTCLMRESAIRRAKELDYITELAQAATVQVALTFPSFNNQFVIPANKSWIINSLPFINTSAINITTGQTAATVTLTQGTAYSTTTTAPGTDWFKITIPQNATSIVVTVNGVAFTAVDSFINPPSPNCYKRYEDIGGQIICFGANISTTAPAAGATIVVTAILTNGASGNYMFNNQNVNLTSIVNDSDGNPINTSIIGKTITSIDGGADVESLESIKQNAPGIYTTQKRVVTKADYEAVMATIPGVTDYIVNGGETIGQYGTVQIIAYGDNPYSVDQGFIDLIVNTLTPLMMLTLTLEVLAPVVVQVQETTSLGIIKTTYSDLTVPTSLENAALTDYYAALSIGDSMYGSARDAAGMNVTGAAYSNSTEVISTFATSQAGVITIPLILNPNLTNCKLTNAAGTVVFSGNGTQYIINNNFVYTITGLTDQVMTLAYSSTDADILVASNQIIVLTNLSINASFLS